jgi:hypothetical protein
MHLEILSIQMEMENTQPMVFEKNTFLIFKKNTFMSFCIEQELCCLESKNK